MLPEWGHIKIIFGCGGIWSMSLQSGSPFVPYIEDYGWPGANKTLFMDTNIFISYHFYVS